MIGRHVGFLQRAIERDLIDQARECAARLGYAWAVRVPKNRSEGTAQPRRALRAGENELPGLASQQGDPD